VSATPTVTAVSKSSGTMSPRLPRSIGVPVGAMAMLAFVAATNRWVSWGDAVHRYHDADPISYRAIAAAAPGASAAPYR
jgi:hypothetical protein